MQIGLMYEFANPPQWQRDQSALFKTQLDQIVWAESIGIDSIWLTEHHFWEDGYLPSPLTLAAAIAARTSRVRIGTSVLLPMLYHPVRLAEDAAVIDAISGGRLELGTGLGWAGAEYDTYGVDAKTRVSRLRETIDILKLAWSDDTLQFKGKHFDVGPINVTPKPVQKPHPPLWGGATTPQGGARVGRWGLPLLWMEPPVVEGYLQGRQEVGLPTGPDDYKVGGFMWLFVCDDPEAVWPRIKPFVHYQMARYSQPHNPEFKVIENPDYLEPKTPGELRERTDYYVLSPDEAIAELKRRAQDIPLHNVHCYANIPGLPEDLANRHVELLATVVAPAVRDAGIPAG